MAESSIGKSFISGHGGITADLESMKRVGLGGALIMEVDQGAPLGPVGFRSSQWRSLFQHVVAEAHRLGLEVNMNNDAGWNGSGGPARTGVTRPVWTSLGAYWTLEQP